MLNRMLRITLCLLALLIFPSLLSATTYYVDCNHGSNSNAGTSPTSAWQTLSPVNGKTFSPGDFILLFSGCTFTGVLSPGGSGSASGGVITIDQYGAGALPRIDGGGIASTVKLSGQSYWDIKDLEITNGGSAGNRQGVLAVATGTSTHIHLVGLFVHDVAGTIGADNGSKATGGIGFESSGGNTAKFDDILVQNCTVGSASDQVNDIGLFMTSDSGTAPRSSNFGQAAWTNVVVEGNHFQNIGKNTIIVRSSNAPVIQYNVINGSSTRLHGNAIYTIGTLNAAIQYNEIYNTALTGYSGLEDAAVDPDNDSVGTLVQYNYSHNNAGGMANPNFIPGAGNYSDGTIIRYNISQSDVHQVIQFSGACTNTQIYNNTIYIGSGLNPIIFGAHLFGGTGGWPNNTTYSNNIVYSAGGGGTYSFGGSTNNHFDANLYFGVGAAPGTDPNVITGKDPLLENAGSGGTGVSTLGGYYLQSSSSPATSSGVVISSNGGLDFFGNTLPGGAPDRGAVQGFTPGPGFTISASPSSQSVSPGSATSYTVTTTGSNGFSGSIALSASGEPAGSSVTFNPATGPGSSTMTVTTSSAASAAGTYTVTVGGAYANILGSTSVALVVSTGPTPPNPPTNLGATAVSSSQINLSWTASTTSGVTYSVFRSTTSGFTAGSGNQIASGVSGTTFSDTGLAASTTYFYLAEAVDSNGSSTPSNQASATTQATACAAAPTAPSGLGATATSSSQINLSWTASTAGTGCSITYSVFRSTTSGFTAGSGNQIASGVSGTTFSDTGLAASTTYFYLTEAVDAVGSSGPSNQASATTQAAPVTCSVLCINGGGPAVSPFVADEDFTGGATIDHANTINTSKVTNPAPAAVYQSARVTATAGAGTTFSYTIGGLSAGTDYLVRLHFAETFHTTAGSRVFNVSINGTQVLTNFDIFATAGGENIANIQQFTEAANSSGQFVLLFTSDVDKALISGIEIDSTAACSTPTAPSGLGATATSSSQINLSWTASTSSCSGITYDVFRSTTNGFTPSSSNQIASGVSATTFSDTGLAASTTYYYVVEGTNSGGTSAASNQASATTSASSGPCTTLCINSGGPAVSPFVADEDFSGGNTLDHANTINTSKVTNPAPAAVYQTARDAVSNPAGGGAPGTTFSYTIGGLAANSSHTVRLHFCETFFTAAGSRVFNVTINGTQVLTNFDIFAAAGGQNIANIQQFTETANASGQYVITFVSDTNNALISGIEID